MFRFASRQFRNQAPLEGSGLGAIEGPSVEIKRICQQPSRKVLELLKKVQDKNGKLNLGPRGTALSINEFAEILEFYYFLHDEKSYRADGNLQAEARELWYSEVNKVFGKGAWVDPVFARHEHVFTRNRMLAWSIALQQAAHSREVSGLPSKAEKAFLNAKNGTAFTDLSGNEMEELLVCIEAAARYYKPALQKVESLRMLPALSLDCISRHLPVEERQCAALEAQYAQAAEHHHGPLPSGVSIFSALTRQAHTLAADLGDATLVLASLLSALPPKRLKVIREDPALAEAVRYVEALNELKHHKFHLPKPRDLSLPSYSWSDVSDRYVQLMDRIAAKHDLSSERKMDPLSLFGLWAASKRFDLMKAGPEHLKSGELEREMLILVAPLAERLGLERLSYELQKLTFQVCHPEQYAATRAGQCAVLGKGKKRDSKVKKREDVVFGLKRSEAREILDDCCRRIEEHGAERGLAAGALHQSARLKGAYSAYKKAIRYFRKQFRLSAQRTFLQSLRDKSGVRAADVLSGKLKEFEAQRALFQRDNNLAAAFDRLTEAQHSLFQVIKLAFTAPSHAVHSSPGDRVSRIISGLRRNGKGYQSAREDLLKVLREGQPQGTKLSRMLETISRIDARFGHAMGIISDAEKEMLRSLKRGYQEEGLYLRRYLAEQNDHLGVKVRELDEESLSLNRDQLLSDLMGEGGEIIEHAQHSDSLRLKRRINGLDFSIPMEFRLRAGEERSASFRKSLAQHEHYKRQQLWQDMYELEAGGVSLGECAFDHLDPAISRDFKSNFRLIADSLAERCHVCVCSGSDHLERKLPAHSCAADLLATLKGSSWKNYMLVRGTVSSGVDSRNLLKPGDELLPGESLSVVEASTEGRRLNARFEHNRDHHLKLKSMLGRVYVEPSSERDRLFAVSQGERILTEAFGGVDAWLEENVLKQFWHRAHLRDFEQLREVLGRGFLSVDELVRWHDLRYARVNVEWNGKHQVRVAIDDDCPKIFEKIAEAAHGHGINLAAVSSRNDADGFPNVLLTVEHTESSSSGKIRRMQEFMRDLRRIHIRRGDGATVDLGLEHEIHARIAAVPGSILALARIISKLNSEELVPNILKISISRPAGDQQTQKVVLKISGPLSALNEHDLKQREAWLKRAGEHLAKATFENCGVQQQLCYEADIGEL